MPNIERKSGVMRVKEVAKLLGVAESTVWLKSREGLFPKPVKLFSRCTCWKAEDVYAFLDNLGTQETVNRP